VLINLAIVYLEHFFFTAIPANRAELKEARLLKYPSIETFCGLRESQEMPSSLYTLNPEDVTTQRPSSSQEQSVNEIVIEQAPIQAGRVGEFNARGRTLKSTLHPLLLQGKAWVSERDINNLAQASFMVCISAELTLTSVGK